jgi:hypothetical protein
LINNKKKDMKQRQSKLGTTSGSFINWMMSSNSSIPEIGMGATELHWSDRTPWEVIAIDKDGKGCTIRQMDYKAKPEAREIGMGHQSWEYSSNEGNATRKLRWRHNAWRYKTERTYRSDKYWEDREHAKLTMGSIEFCQWLKKYDIKDAQIFPEYFEHEVEWHKMSILFGHAEYHYDWEF